MNMSDKMIRDFQTFMKTMQDDIFADMAEKMGAALGGTGAFGKAGTMGMNPYAMLGLEKSASDDEVRTRFRELAKLLHPDTATVKGTSFLFQMVNIANEMITRERSNK